MTRAEAFDALQEAYAAQDAALDHGAADIKRQFAGIIKRRQQEFQDAVRREAGDDRSALALGNKQETH